MHCYQSNVIKQQKQTKYVQLPAGSQTGKACVVCEIRCYCTNKGNMQSQRKMATAVKNSHGQI